LRRTGSLTVSRSGLAIFSVLTCAVCIWLAIGITEPVPAVLLISLGAFLASMASPCGYSITMDLGGKHTPTVFGLMNMSGNIGAMLFPIVVGYILTLSGNDWNLVMYFFAALYLAAGVCWILLRPRPVT